MRRCLNPPACRGELTTDIPDSGEGGTRGGQKDQRPPQHRATLFQTSALVDAGGARHDATGLGLIAAIMVSGLMLGLRLA